MKKGKLFAVAALILTALLVFAACSPAEPDPTPVPKTETPEADQPAQEPQNTDGMEDRAAPDFTLKGFDEQEYTLSQYYNDVVVLNFWAIGCPPCVEEMPDLDKINNLDYVTVVTVAPNGVLGNEYDRSKEFIEKFGTAALWDDTRTTLELYPSQYFPHTYVIDRTGTIRYSIRGMTNYNDLTEKVEKVNELG